ncbi:hypothetical protein [Methanogenium cariaci]|uniref:hypothetical protein n=1 Tax=Methanogenium cariaci TaxID=2197 RepID=UPI0007823A41|nr:hypothetical protein [Methanogenium cariaci]
MPIFWTAGLVSGISGLVSVALPSRILNFSSFRRGGICIMGSGILYLVALIAQYGPSFSSSGGFAIPVGVPVLVVAGWLVWSGILFPDAGETDENEPEVSQDNSS